MDPILCSPFFFFFLGVFQSLFSCIDPLKEVEIPIDHAFENTCFDVARDRLLDLKRIQLLGHVNSIFLFPFVQYVSNHWNGNVEPIKLFPGVSASSRCHLRFLCCNGTSTFFNMFFFLFLFNCLFPSVNSNYSLLFVSSLNFRVSS